MKEDLIAYEMIDFNLRVAQKLLEDYGEFYPIACVREIGSDNSTAVITYSDNEMPTSVAVINELTAAMNGSHYLGKILAACICVDVKDNQSGGSAFDFWVHILGFDGLKVTWPYELKDGIVQMKKPREEQGVMFLKTVS